MVDLISNINKDIEITKKAVAEIGARGRRYAEAYTNYRKLLRQKILELKAEGYPVTLIQDLARGDEDVANAKEEEIATESDYKACLEAINTYKLSANVQKTQYEKEYSNVDL